MIVRRRVLVSGRVQGVFYRDTCREMAWRHGVGGWVRNRRDGQVEAAFEGDLDAVGAMVDWCRRGPAGAVVVSVDITDEQPTGEESFRVAGTA
jgi:acylphosphatase